MKNRLIQRGKDCNLSIYKTFTLCLLLLCLFNYRVFASDTTIKDEISENYPIKKTLKQVFDYVEKNSKYVFLYNKADVELNKRVSFEVEKLSIQEILNELSKDPELEYKIDKRQINVKRKTTSKKSPLSSKQILAGITIKGVVTDTNRDPLIGVTVAVKGTTIGTSTGLDGNFLLELPAGQNTIEISYLGFKKQTIIVQSDRPLNIVLEEESQVMDEVVIVGFGTQKKASIVGAVESIRPRELRTSSSSLMNSMSGRIAGVISVQRGGEPGADGASFWIRGVSTFNSASASPLIFIDGIEVSSSELNGLSPEVIENFSILKDATATAIYGARGANGVMLITTRQGKESERVNINIRIENSFTSPVKKVKFADPIQYMRLYNEAILTRNPSGIPRFDEQTKIMPTIENRNSILYPQVDWDDVLFKDYATTQTVNLNASGGGKRVTYFLNATFNNDNGMLKKDKLKSFDNSLSYQRISLQGNIGVHLTSTTKAILRINSQISTHKGSNYSTQDLYSSLFVANPVLFPVTYPNRGEDHILFGNASGGPISWGGADIYRNPYADMVSGYKSVHTSTVNSSLEIEQDLKMLTPGLKIKGLISFKNMSQTGVYRYSTPFFYGLKSFSENPDGNFDYETQILTKGENALKTNTSSTGDRLFNFQALVEYNRTFGQHTIGGMFVYLQRDYNINNPDNDFYKVLPIRNQGIAGRITYNFDDRYLIEGNFGYNGSENLAENKRFGFFPSIAIGYMISNESFFAPLSNAISKLKIRGSYGIVGSSFTEPRFPYLTFVNLNNENKGYTFGDDWQNYKSGISIDKYGTADAHWERGKKLNGGIDIGFLRNTLNVSLDIFHEIRSDIFMQRRVISVESGISSSINPYGNIGKMKNYGGEVSITYDNQISKDLYVSFRGNFSYAKNILLNRDEPQLNYAYLSELNRPINRNVGLVSLGLFESQEDIDNSPVQTFSPKSQLRPGDIKYADLNGDNKIDEQDMKQLGYPTVPQIVYGFGASAKYKKFDFSVFFQGVAQTSLMMSNIHPYTPDETVLFDFIAKDHWSESNPNPNATYPRLTHNQSTSFNNYQASDYWLRNASFLRLKNMEIGYSHKYVRAYISGQNLLTFSPFKYWDPELGGGNGLSYPNLRMITLGLQLTY